MRDRPFTQRHTTCATTGYTRAPSQPAQVQPSPPERKPRLFNKRIILWGAEKCCRNVTAVRYDRRARHAERVVRDFIGIGVRTESRRSRTSSPDAREGYRILSGVFSSTQPANQPIYDPSPPPLEIRVSLSQIAATPLELSGSAKIHPQTPKP